VQADSAAVAEELEQPLGDSAAAGFAAAELLRDWFDTAAAALG
jgi:hypothetical protein